MLKRTKAKPKARIKRASQKDVPRLKRKLKALLYPKIKERDGNTCFSSGRGDLFGSGWHAGHLFPAGSHSATMWHPRNIHSQSYHANINLGGDGARYSEAFIRRYGIEFFNEMASASKPTKKWAAWELELLIEKIQEGLEAYEEYYSETYGPRLSVASKP